MRQCDDTGQRVCHRYTSAHTVRRQQLPVWTENGYQVVEIIGLNKALQLNGTKYVFQPLFEDYARGLLSNPANTGVSIVVRVSWAKNENATMATQDFVYSDEFVSQFMANYDPSTGKYGKMFTITIKDANEYSALSFQTVVKSDTRVELVP